MLLPLPAVTAQSGADVVKDSIDVWLVDETPSEVLPSAEHGVEYMLRLLPTLVVTAHSGTVVVADVEKTWLAERLETLVLLLIREQGVL